MQLVSVQGRAVRAPHLPSAITFGDNCQQIPAEPGGARPVGTRFKNLWKGVNLERSSVKVSTMFQVGTFTFHADSLLNNGT